MRYLALVLLVACGAEKPEEDLISCCFRPGAIAAPDTGEVLGLDYCITENDGSECCTYWQELPQGRCTYFHCREANDCVWETSRWSCEPI